MKYSHLISSISLKLMLSTFMIPSLAMATSQVPNQSYQQQDSTQQFFIHSKNTGQEYFIQLYIPKSVPPKAGFPVLYVLDGDAIFESARNLARFIANPSKVQSDMQPVVIVAIGYQNKTIDFDKQKRAFDLTPIPTTAQQKDAHFKYGGADKFAQFIQQELKPVIQQKIQINPQQQAIYGHSFGGLFVMDLFFKKPKTFQKFIAASPSIWFNNFQLIEQQTTWLNQKISTHPMLMLTYGSNEGLGPSQTDQQRTTYFKEQFFGRFTALNPTQAIWVYQQPGEQHLTNFYASLPKALLLASCQTLQSCKQLLDLPLSQK